MELTLKQKQELINEEIAAFIRELPEHQPSHRSPDLEFLSTIFWGAVAIKFDFYLRTHSSHSSPIKSNHAEVDELITLFMPSIEAQVNRLKLLSIIIFELNNQIEKVEKLFSEAEEVELIKPETKKLIQKSIPLNIVTISHLQFLFIIYFFFENQICNTKEITGVNSSLMTIGNLLKKYAYEQYNYEVIIFTQDTFNFPSKVIKKDLYIELNKENPNQSRINRFKSEIEKLCNEFTQVENVAYTLFSHVVRIYIDKFSKQLPESVYKEWKSTEIEFLDIRNLQGKLAIINGDFKVYPGRGKAKKKNNNAP